MNKTIIKYILIALGGIFLGWLFFHSPKKTEDKHEHVTETQKATVWTCSMHPQIRMDKPGKCPICGMDLIPLNQSTASIDPDAVHFSSEAAALANVLTSVVSKQKPTKEIRLYGKIQADERLLQSQVAHIPGRIEKLMLNVTGETVRKGQTLAVIFSPELVTAQQELLEASKSKQAQPEIYEAVKEKLRLWMLSEQQIASIESSGKVKNNFEVYSNTSGIITARRVNVGDHIAVGTVLFDVADLSKLWVLFDAYETDLPFLNQGNKISFTVQALPGQTFTGNITFIDPVIDPTTRVSKVRVEINNNSGKLKPEMFVTGIVNANLAQYANNIIIPRSAVLWTGERSIVYVKQAGSDDMIFKIREIELGPMLGNSFVVMKGLEEGEEIVTQGTFSVDAAAQLEGKPSMMNNDSTVQIQATSQKKSNKESVSKNPGNLKNPAFSLQFNKVYDQYIYLKNAFVQSDAGKVQVAAKKLQQTISGMDMNMLSGEAHSRWMDISSKLIGHVKSIAASKNIVTQRTAFSDLNDELYSAIKTFGLAKKTVYYQFCPMAKDGKGAYWLSETEPIRNPYYGDEMLTCGENRETLKY